MNDIWQLQASTAEITAGGAKWLGYEINFKATEASTRESEQHC